jgi:hypothetical protein
MWDNYIANNNAATLDPGNLWPMNLDLDSLGAVGGMQQNEQQQNQQQSANSMPSASTVSNPGSIFATAPGSNGMM